MQLSNKESTEALEEIMTLLSSNKAPHLQHKFQTPQHPQVTVGTMLTIVIAAVVVALGISYIGLNTRDNRNQIETYKIQTDQRISEINDTIQNGFVEMRNSQEALAKRIERKDEIYLEKLMAIKGRTDDMENIISRIATQQRYEYEKK